MRIIGNRCHYVTKQIFAIVISVHNISNAADSPLLTHFLGYMKCAKLLASCMQKKIYTKHAHVCTQKKDCSK